MLTDLFDQAQLQTLQAVCEHQRGYVFADVGIQVFSNNAALLDELDRYYKSYLGHSEARHNIALYVVEHAVVGDELEWLEVPREAGKTGRKEGYLDAWPGARWIKKFKTGLTLLQANEKPTVVGPCGQNLAQIVNFINNQCLNHYLSQGYELGHASAFVRDGKMTAIAAGSGGGKSTLMLRCLEDSGRDFITNDRLLFKRSGEQVHGVGIAKLPRVNPGTLLNAERLKHILPESRQQALLALSTAELWSLEEKYDVQIEDEYGQGRVATEGQLANLVMLDWSLDSAVPTALLEVDLANEAPVIDGLRKRPGPFYQNQAGEFCSDLNELASLAHYSQALAPVKVYRLTGRIDFDRAFELLENL
ncbi:hypothetical protein MAQ5080_00857 [Marinomonas aquimarina]|uniref:Uncharacterized protein n=1 Tax=Marinomonas aquimarina TaxID=295068 RepID=A0A1A8T5F1_9GAMM|nr:HprK-related kinase B [Marinomonas aquimarina]SBS27572.1 hypothetical protein MAQ5080_00857 [Marinomonas aquimarina]